MNKEIKMELRKKIKLTKKKNEKIKQKRRLKILQIRIKRRKRKLRINGGTRLKKGEKELRKN